MSEKKHVYEIIGKDEFNLKILNETLNDIKESIFNNLYDAQKVLTNMIRFDFDMADMTRLSNSECTYNINMQFITNKSRTAFKQSKFYKKNVTPDEINANPNIFNNNIFVFINGEMYTNFYVQPIENITRITFKLFEHFPSDTSNRYLRTGFSRIEMNDLIESHAKMTIIIVKAHNMSFLESNRGTVRNYTVVPKYNGIPMVDFENTNKISETESFTTWVTYDDDRLYKYKYISAVKNNDNKLKLDDTQINTLTNNYVNIRNIFLLDHFQTITLPANTEYFELPIKDMPIPIENMLIFKKNGTDILFDHDRSVTLYYPNIYKINNVHSEELILYVYYTDDTKTLGSKYENELSLYYRFTNNILDKYKADSIPEIIKNYKPISMTYDHDDLNKSQLDHYVYKIDKLDSMIYQNGNYYSIYLNKLIDYVPAFDINVSEIDDLNYRYRLNNKDEVSQISKHTVFDEPCYLFTFRYTSGEMLNVLVDNYQTNEIYIYYDKKYCYVYIPTRFIKSDSIITIEKFTDYKYKQTITISDNSTYYKINIPESQKIKISDIYVTTKSLSDDEIYLSKNDYSIYRLVNGLYEEITINDFYNYKNIYIKFNNPLDINKDVNVVVNRISFKEVVTGTNTITINREINNDTRNILLYRNGRLVPQKLRKYEFSDNINGPHTIRCSMKQDPNDEYTLIYNTNKYHMVYYQKSINNKGIVNLTGKISKPLDLKWYDIYINGLRLHKSNIEIIGPYIFLLKNVPTLTNLEIYQKNLDSLNWDSDYSTDDISSKIFDEIVEDIDKGLPEITDDIPDMFDDVIVELIEFFDEYLRVIKLINPDLNQINQSMINKYNTVFIDSNDLFLNPNNAYITESNVFLNPNVDTVIGS